MRSSFLRSKRLSKTVKRLRRRTGRVLGRVAVLVGGPAAISQASGAPGQPTGARLGRGTPEVGRSAQEFDSPLPPAPTIRSKWPEPPQVQGAHDVVRTVEQSILASRRSAEDAPDLGNAPLGAVTEEEWRAHWPT